MGGVAGALGKTRHPDKVGGSGWKSRKRPGGGNGETRCAAGEKGPSSQVQAKGGTSVAGTKEKEDLQGGGQRGRGDQKEDGSARGPDDPDGSPDTPELTGGGGLTCQQNAEIHKTKKTPTPRVGNRAAPSCSHLASRLSGSFPSPPLRQWVL